MQVFCFVLFLRKIVILLCLKEVISFLKRPFLKPVVFAYSPTLPFKASLLRRYWESVTKDYRGNKLPTCLSVRIQAKSRDRNRICYSGS